jgi:hypothetical protein
VCVHGRKPLYTKEGGGNCAKHSRSCHLEVQPDEVGHFRVFWVLLEPLQGLFWRARRAHLLQLLGFGRLGLLGCSLA